MKVKEKRVGEHFLQMCKTVDQIGFVKLPNPERVANCNQGVRESDASPFCCDFCMAQWRGEQVRDSVSGFKSGIIN